MGILISGNGIDMLGNPVSNASKIDSTVINENGNNVRTENDSYSKTEVDSKIVGFKNYIINGNFDIWQRGTSQTSGGYGSDDRWANPNSGSTKTHSQVACTDTERALFNASYFSRTVVSSVAGVSNNVHKYQLIENINKLAGKTVTLSFWAKADGSKNIAVEFGQLFGTGGSPSAIVSGVGAQLIPLTTTWQKKTITVTLPSIIGKTLGTDGVHTSSTYLFFWFDSGSSFNSRSASLGQQSGTFDIAQVQLEEGSIATPFENRPYGLELSLCQRYYEKIGNDIHSIYCDGYSGIPGPLMGTTIPFKATKRVQPTVTKVGTWVVNNCNQPVVGGFGVDCVQIRASITSAGAGSFGSTTSAYIEASAEL